MKRRSRRVLCTFCGVALAATLLLAPPIEAQNCAPRNSNAVSDADSIKLSYNQGSTSQLQAVQQGASSWQEACPGAGVTYPRVVVNQTPAALHITINVFFGTGVGPDGHCGAYFRQSNAATNQTTRGHIWLYPVTADGFICNQPDTLAHEVGHVLGLDHPTNAATGCKGTIMGHPEDTSGVLEDRMIGADACRGAREAWETPFEVGVSGGCAGQNCSPCSF